MTEEDARRWIRDRFGVPRETLLAQFVEFVVEEQSRQNLIAPSTIASVWSRHIVDSAQLIRLAPAWSHWADIGTGAGFPGMVVALLSEGRVSLIDPRKRRADFLSAAAAKLGLEERVDVYQAKAEGVSLKADVISARALTMLSGTLAAGAHLAHADAVWLLPKGRNAREEVAQAQRTWHGSFHVEQSVTDPVSLIVVARDVRRR